MRRTTVGCRFVIVSVCMLLPLRHLTFAAGPSDGESSKPVLELQIPLNDSHTAVRGTVAGLSRDTLNIRTLPSTGSTDSDKRRETVVEGYYVGILGEYLPSLIHARLLRVRVFDVADFGSVRAQVGTGLQDKIKLGEQILLIRPPNVSTAQMGSLPDFVVVEEASERGKPNDEGEQLRVTRSIMNLKCIGRALHDFYDSQNHFPPAFLVGPDGKPWHSWRVLLLPYLNERRLYYRYRFDEPWDSPNNSELLNSIPPMYTDEPHGRATDQFTRYAAVVGEGMAFTGNGPTFEGKLLRFRAGAGLRLSHLIDGASNTLCIGTVQRDAAIPWTKPADVLIEDPKVVIGSKGGFGAPYNIGQNNFGLFLRFDGMPVGIFDSIEPSDFHAMLTIADRKPSNLATVDAVFIPIATGVLEDGPVVYLFQEGGQTKAHLAR